MDPPGGPSILSQQFSRRMAPPSKPNLTEAERQSIRARVRQVELEHRQLASLLAEDESALAVSRYIGSPTGLAAMAMDMNMTPTTRHERTNDDSHRAPEMARSISSRSTGMPIPRSRHSSITQAPRIIEPSSLSTSDADRGYMIYSPEEYISIFGDTSECSVPKRQKLQPLNTTSMASPAMSFASTQNSSLPSSSFLTPPSSTSSFVYNSGTHKGADSQQGTRMSRQPSVASSIGISRPLGMMRMGSSASQTNTDSMMFPFEPDFPPSVFNVARGGVMSDRSNPLVYQGTGMFDDGLLRGVGSGVDEASQPTSSFENSHELDASMPTSADMQRTTSSTSTSSNGSKASERHQRHLENSKQPIKSKAVLSSLSRAISATDSREGRQPIMKVPYKRPKQQRQKCLECNEHPDGFHGAHELRRHFENAHATHKKVWICVQPPIVPSNEQPKRPLNICKACQQNRQYNVYYNAAAHIRRAHFHPKPRGRRPRGEPRESRAGSAGGDHPSIQWLKQNGWIKEIEIVVERKDKSMQSTSAKCDSMFSCSDEHSDIDTHTYGGPAANNVKQETWSADGDGNNFDAQDVLPGIAWDESIMDSSFMGEGMSFPDGVEFKSSFGSDLCLDDVFEQ